MAPHSLTRSLTKGRGSDRSIPCSILPLPREVQSLSSAFSDRHEEGEDNSRFDISLVPLSNPKEYLRGRDGFRRVDVTTVPVDRLPSHGSFVIGIGA